MRSRSSAAARRSTSTSARARFLHIQVRILVGTLQLVGRGQWNKADVEAALAALRPHPCRARPHHRSDSAYWKFGTTSAAAGGSRPEESIDEN
jgi:hypothetical protein